MATEFRQDGPIDQAVVIRRLCKYFGTVVALDDVTLTIEAGQIVMIIGPSGSGKSTLLRCINRLEIPTSGSLTVAGYDFSDPKLDLNRVRAEVGMVFQQYELFPHLTALQNVTLAQRLVLKAPKHEAERTALDLLRTMNLSEKAHAHPGELSGGQKQRVAMARALALKPKVLLLDEPTSALDPETKQVVVQVVKDKAAGGTTFVLVSHDLELLKNLPTRIIFLDRGRVIEDATPEEIMSNPRSERTRLFLTSPTT